MHEKSSREPRSEARCLNASRKRARSTGKINSSISDDAFYLLDHFVTGLVIGLLLDGISERGQRSQRYALLDASQLRIDPHLIHRAVAQPAKHIRTIRVTFPPFDYPRDFISLRRLTLPRLEQLDETSR